MAACTYCGTSLPDRALFCSQCAQQVRCRACRASLEANARACVECGTLIDQVTGASTSTATTSSARTSALNRFHLEETKSSRTVDVNFTDAAIESLSGPLSAYMISGLSGGGQARSRRHIVPPPAEFEGQTLVAPGQVYEAVSDDVSAVTTPLLSSTIQPSDDERLRSLFRDDEGRLRLDETRLKGDSDLEQARRLTFLRLLYARRIEGRDQIEREKIVSISRDAGWFNSMTLSRIINSAEFIVDDRMIGLRQAGRERAITILQEVFDSTIQQPEYEPSRGKAGRKSGGKGDKTATDKNPTRREGNKTQSVSKLLTAWQNLSLQINGYNILKDRSLAEQGIFGLWAIRKATNDGSKVVTAYGVAQFLFKAFEIQVDERNLSRALSDDNVKGKTVMQVEGTKFQITPDGMALAERLANLPQSPHNGTAGRKKANGTS